jgi:hypothetical protein
LKADYPYFYAWGNNEKRKTMKGRKCRVLVKGGALHSIMIEFENGQKEIVSQRSVRRIENEKDNG